MKIYIAGRFDDQDRLQYQRARLVALGHEVISTWLDKTDSTRDTNLSLEAALAEAHSEADRDLTEVWNADLVIVDTDGQTRRGGRETELGAAIAGCWASGRPRLVWAVGPWEHGKNIFYTLAKPYDTWDAVIEAVGEVAR